VRELVEGLVAAVEAGRGLGAAGGSLPAAQVRLAPQAILAAPAEGREAADDVVAGLYVAHLCPHFLDHPGGLVAEHRRRRDGQAAFEAVQVTVADATGDGADAYLPGAQ